MANFVQILTAAIFSILLNTWITQAHQKYTRVSAFSVIKSSPIRIMSPNDVIVKPYNSMLTNEGNDLDMESGMYTAPEDGVYHFSFFFTTSSPDTLTKVQLVLQDGDTNTAKVMVTVSGDADYKDTTSASLILDLKTGDRVYLQIHHHTDADSASLDADEESPLIFNGFLMYRDII